MTPKMIAALLLLAPAFAAAAAPYYSPDTIYQGVELTHRAAAGGSVETTHAYGHGLQEMLTGGSVMFRPSLHEVQRAKTTGSPTFFDDMQRDAEAARQESIHVPETEVNASVDRLAALNAQERVIRDGTLADDTMGAFQYAAGKTAEGIVALNAYLPYIGGVVGSLFAYATAVHEGAHAADPELERGVINGEVFAFEAQYKWLKFVDPTGEKLGLLVLFLQGQMRDHPTKFTQMALGYADTLNVLYGTGGDKQKIREFAHTLGYREGEHNHGRLTASQPPSA